MNRYLLLLALVPGLLIVSWASAGTIMDLSFLPPGTPATVDEAVILSTTDLTADPLYKSFQIRDTTRAMTIYGTNGEIEAALAGFDVGGVISISGQTAKVDGALALVTGSYGGFAVSGRTSTAPLLTNAVLVAPSNIAASYESNLVYLNNVAFVADTGNFAAGDYALANGATVRIVSDDLGFTSSPIPSGPLNITGIVIPTDPTSPDNGYCLAPRGPADIVSVPEPSTLTLLVLGGVGMLFMRRGVRFNRRLPLLVLLVGVLVVCSASAGTIVDIAALPLGTDATIDQAIILSTTDLIADPLYKSFQIRDTTRAMTIYGTNAQIDAALTGLDVGGVIQISGQTADVDGALALITGTVGGFAVSGRGNTNLLLSNALLVSPPDIAQPFESNLVCLKNVSFANTSLGPSTFAVGDYALTNGAFVRIASDGLGLTGRAIPAGPLDISGIVIPSGPTSPGSYCLAPRGPADMVSVPEPSTLTLLVLGGAGMLLKLWGVRMKRHLPLLFVLVALWIVFPVSAGTIADIAALPLGSDATVDQAVILSTTDLTADPLYKSFQIRDTTRAMTICGTNGEIDAALAGFGVGDVITISGQTASVDGALALITGTYGGFAVTGQTSTLPLPTNAVLVAPSNIAASYESNLVYLSNVSFASTLTGTGTFTAGDYPLDNGAIVRVTSDDLGLTGCPIPSGPLNITGVVIPAASSGGEYRLAPRGPADIVSVPEPTTLGLLVLGALSVITYAWRKRRAA